MMDYQLVKFPDGVGARNGDDSAARYFDHLNQGGTTGTCTAGKGVGGAEVEWASVLQRAKAAVAMGGAVVSFSHFLPRVRASEIASQLPAFASWQPAAQSRAHCQQQLYCTGSVQALCSE